MQNWWPKQVFQAWLANFSGILTKKPSAVRTKRGVVMNWLRLFPIYLYIRAFKWDRSYKFRTKNVGRAFKIWHKLVLIHVQYMRINILKKNLRIKNISWDNVDYWNHNLERDLLLNIQVINLQWWKFMFSTYDVDKKMALPSDLIWQEFLQINETSSKRALFRDICLCFGQSGSRGLL